MVELVFVNMVDRELNARTVMALAYASIIVYVIHAQSATVAVYVNTKR